MLELIRNNVQSFGVKFIVGIVCVVMLGFGVSVYNNQDINTLLAIDGYEIKMDAYQRALSQAEQAIKARYGDKAADYMKMINLKQQIINQLSSNVLLIKNAEENGLGVTDEELAREIYQDPSFITDGRFDKEKYESSLQNNRIEKLNYEKDFRERLATRKLIRFLTSDQLISRKSLVSEYKRFNSEMEIQTIEFTPEMFSDKLKLSDKEIEDYYNSRKNDFMLNPRIVINYFTLGMDDVKQKTLVREKETLRYYQKNKKDFTRKESFLIKQILISAPQDGDSQKMEAAEKKAKKIRRQLLKNPKKFAALSRKHSADPFSAKKGGDMGWLNKGEFPLTGEFGEAVEKLKKNEISKPFLTSQGYHIIKLSDKKDAYIVPLKEVRSEIENNIRIKKAQRRLKNKIAKLSKKIKEQPLTALAASLNKTVVKSPPFDETGNIGPDIKSPQLYYLLKAKKARKGHFNPPDDDRIIVYEIESVSEPSPKPLKEIKDEVKLLAKQEKLQKITKEKTQKYSSNIKTAEQFKKLSSKLKLKPSKIKFKLSDLEIQPINVGRHFRIEAFKMKPKQFKVISEDDRHFLVYLVAKHDGEIQDEDQERLEILKNQLKQQKAQTLLYALINEMQKKVDIQYNDSILKALGIK